MYHTCQKRIEQTDQLDFLAHECGKVYSRCVDIFHRVWRKKGFWLSEKSMKRLVRNSNLHSQTVQGVIEKFYENLSSYNELKKVFPNTKPPRKRKWYFTIPYKSSAIHLKDGVLKLSNGRGNEPLAIPWQHTEPKTLEISFNLGYRVNATYVLENTEIPLGNKVASIDLGEIILAATHEEDGSTTLYNGRVWRSKQRYLNKTDAKFKELMSRCRKGSKRWKRLKRAKNRIHARINNQKEDILHKQTTKLVNTLHEKQVGTVVMGDARFIRLADKTRKKSNQAQHVHQMPTGKVRHKITYKANRKGMKVELINEAYTSRVCPACKELNHTNGRVYKCESCNLVLHRDEVGAINILAKQKYREYVPVVGDMTPPIGVRYSSVA